MTSSPIRFATSLCVLVLAAATGIAGAPPTQGSPPARPKVGLALGGGSAKGLAHIGVLRWFEEHRIPIDVVSGTSMGGLVGGAYATGMTPAELASMMKATDWDLMFLADSPFKYKTFRRKQDKRAYPSQIEFGLKHGFNTAGGAQPGAAGGPHARPDRAPVLRHRLVRRSADAVPVRGHRPQDGRDRRALARAASPWRCARRCRCRRSSHRSATTTGCWWTAGR